MTLVLRYSARSDRGLVRQNNQDSVYAGPRLLAVADGMGGHAAGDVASSLVIAALAPLDEDDPGDDLLAELREATVEGNAAITAARRGAPRPGGHGHHAHGDAVRGQPARPGPHRRLAGLPAPRRRALADHQGRHVRPVADRRGPDHRGGGAHAPAALAAAARHDRAGHRARRSRCARPGPATATCSAPTACPAWSATRRWPRRWPLPPTRASAPTA